MTTQATQPLSPLAGQRPSPKARPSADPRDLWITFFFDGTGNNLEADKGTDEHSNVARLFLAHQDEDSSKGLFRVYIPGLGTRFKEIGDPGGEASGRGFGARGDARLQWAMAQLDFYLTNSAPKARCVNVALFGFSRGATLARAFAQRIAERSKRSSDGSWSILPRGYPINLYFMGLFDSVASVGLAMSSNNAGVLGLASAQAAMATRYLVQNPNSPWHIAGGATPGANPSKGLFDGHGSWAKDLRIPEMVGECIHLIAAHEVRNSFPVDSLLQGHFYPSNCFEFVLPGVHSDVGGGYRPGEGARGLAPGGMLSLVALRKMHTHALNAGVPLFLEVPKMRQKDFGMDAASDANFQVLQGLYDHYVKVAGARVGQPLGKQVLAHMKLYYQWRFHQIALNQRDRKAGKPTQDAQRLRAAEPHWAAQREARKADMARLKAEEEQAEADNRRTTFKMLQERVAPASAYFGQLEAYRGLAKQKRNEYLATKAVLDTLPGADGSLEQNLRRYDEQLLADVQALKLLAKAKKLRPHYRALLDAYEAEFEKGQGLRDANVIMFFNEYVHDSLAGFAGDATLPSDPRVIYIGGDTALLYALNSSPQSGVSDLA